MNDLIIPQESALNLTLKGTVGSFRVGSTSSPQNRSFEVKYFLTHVGLNFTEGSDDAFLSHIAPVREIFDPKTLDFDEIMQRDIDDARVSDKLVPYLLDDSAQDLIKLFPPIVVVVLPVEEMRNKPAEKYPKLVQKEEKMNSYDYLITRVGEIGAELFQFEQPIQNGKPITSDLVRFKLNTSKTRLIIVDGQHRAMALLAIYRNLKDQWSDERRAPYKEFYAEWTPSYIQRFNLGEIQLPVMICTFPELNSDYHGDFNLKKAARAIFLTLNKNARKVSESRNKLLDDYDLIAHFMRDCLSKIKAKDERSESPIRIWNVELDQHLDKIRIKSPVAITGVSHVYYLIEQLMMESDVVNGVAPRSGKFSMRTNLNDCLDKLDGRNLLGMDVSGSIRRDFFTREAAETLGKVFQEKYGQYIVDVFGVFDPYSAHCKATLDVRRSVEASTYREILPILFDGQGVGRVFQSHRETLERKLKDNYFKSDVPEIKASLNRLNGTAKNIENAQAILRQKRALYFLSKISEKSKLLNEKGEVSEEIGKLINDLYENVYSTVAFQTAVTCGFFSELDKLSECADRRAVFTEYLTQISDFFSPTSISKLKQLIQVFLFEVEGDHPQSWKFVPSNQTFRHIVYRAEMQPAQWPKYRYLILEIWNPKDEVLGKQVSEQRNICREEIFNDLYHHAKMRYLSDNRKQEETLNKGEEAGIFDDCFGRFKAFLSYLKAASSLEKSRMKQAIKLPYEESEIGQGGSGYDED